MEWIIVTDKNEDGQVVLGNGRPYHVHQKQAPHWSIADCSTLTDAQLIASAPGLLEACRACDRAFCSWQLGQIPGRPADILALIIQVRAAIAKAGGDEP